MWWTSHPKVPPQWADSDFKVLEEIRDAGQNQ